MLGVDGTKIAREGVPADFPDGTCEFNTGGASAHDDEGEQGLLSIMIGLGFGFLERFEHAAPDLDGLLHGLQARSICLPRFVAEIGVADAAGKDEIIVGVAALVGENSALGEIDRRCSFSANGGSGVPREEAADRCSDFRRAENSHGNLVEQGLEEVVIALIQERDFHVAFPGQSPGGAQASKPAAHDDHFRHSRSL